MRERNAQQSFLLGAGAAASLMLLGCADYLTGQDGEPRGPLRVTKLTLNDNNLNRPSHSVVTDTSVPPDCDAPAAASTLQCTADPFRDTYGVRRSPPNPDSARILQTLKRSLRLMYPEERVIALEGDPRDAGLAAGQALYTGVGAKGGVSHSCADCHVDGLTDGNVWSAGGFSESASRPMFWLEGRAAIGWEGDAHDLFSYLYGSPGPTIGATVTTELHQAFYDYLAEFVPPDTQPAFLRKVAQGTAETLAMSALGTLLAALGGLALALPASRPAPLAAAPAPPPPSWGSGSRVGGLSVRQSTRPARWA